MSQINELSSIESIIEDAKAGKMFILVDDEDRENEGDLIIPAEKADDQAINFMAMHGRGLICLALECDRVETLGLPLMSQSNQSRHQTAFTISIEAREGVSTGISAADRARTIAVAIDQTKNATDIVSPGHVFPLVARDGGVLVRAGHTEAAVDIARLAGLNPSGVICEIMKDDGTMARLPDLITFAKKHDLKIATIADLIAYRRRQEKLVTKTLEMPFTSQHGGEFTLMVYGSEILTAEHIVLVKGDLSKESPAWVRMHTHHILTDTLLDQSHPKTGELQAAMNKIANHGSGAIVILRLPRPHALSDTIRAQLEGQTKPRDSHSDLRDYGIGAQILLDLGIKDMVLLSNSRRQIVGLEGYGLNIVDYETIGTS